MTATARKVIVHYHLFKNGGSSIERMLQNGFGERWMSFDRSSSGARIAASELESHLRDHPDVRAVSSHQLVPPEPGGEFEVTPIVFLRDPLARVRSAWLFEWQKQPGLDEPRGSLADYVRSKLEHSHTNVIANFQCSRLSHADRNNARQTFDRHDQAALRRACDWLDSLPFFGLVERFAESLEWMRPVMAERFPELALIEHRENVLQDVAHDRVTRLDRLRADLGDELFDRLCTCNQLDLQLYAYAEGRFGRAVEALRDGQSASGLRHATEAANDASGGARPIERLLRYCRGQIDG